MNDNEDQGYVPLAPPSQRQPVKTPQPSSAAPIGNDQGYVPLTPPAQQQTGGGGQQQQQSQPGDWSKVAWNEATMGTIPGLRTQAEAARQRLGPVAAASADVMGNIGSPTTALNFIPWVGPPLAGAAHEGIKSAVTNWRPDESWPTYLKNVGEDTVGGAAWGGLGGIAAKAAPIVSPLAARIAVQGGIPTALGTAGHLLFGQGDLYREAAHIVPEAAAFFGLSNLGERAGDLAGKAMATPYAQQAIKNLVLGAGSAARTAAGPYDNWMGAGP